jgi:hypothetical protein
VEWIDRNVCLFCCYLLIVRRKVDPVRRLKGQCEQKDRRGNQGKLRIGKFAKRIGGLSRM